MRLVIMFIALFTMFSQGQASTLWDEYRVARDSAKADLAVLEAGNTVAAVAVTVQKFDAVAGIAKTLNRKDIEAWQYNNAGYSYILQFKNTLGWQAQNAKIASTTDKKDRRIKAAALQAGVIAQKGLLDAAEPWLAKAAAVGVSQTAVMTAVRSNRDFIRWVKEFSGKKF